MTDNPKKLADVEKRRKILTQLENADFERVLDTYEGRHLLWWLLEHARIYTTTFDTEFGNMAFFEGRRSIGLIVLDRIMELRPQAYDKMRAEAVDRRERYLTEKGTDDE